MELKTELPRDTNTTKIIKHAKAALRAAQDKQVLL